MDYMFFNCPSLKKENVKISKNGGKIMDEIKKYLE
jgi:predicted enzyme related to lactoylglutathione lyase